MKVADGGEMSWEEGYLVVISRIKQENFQGCEMIVLKLDDIVTKKD